MRIYSKLSDAQKKFCDKVCENFNITMLGEYVGDKVSINDTQSVFSYCIELAG